MRHALVLRLSNMPSCVDSGHACHHRCLPSPALGALPVSHVPPEETEHDPRDKCRAILHAELREKTQSAG